MVWVILAIIATVALLGIFSDTDEDSGFTCGGLIFLIASIIFTYKKSYDYLSVKVRNSYWFRSAFAYICNFFENGGFKAIFDKSPIFFYTVGLLILISLIILFFKKHLTQILTNLSAIETQKSINRIQEEIDIYCNERISQPYEDVHKSLLEKYLPHYPNKDEEALSELIENRLELNGKRKTTSNGTILYQTNAYCTRKQIEEDDKLAAKRSEISGKINLSDLNQTIKK